jgi:plasmid stability protein
MMAKRHGGARTGAGRKVQGEGKPEMFSTRISAETRAALEATAAEQGRSLAAVAEDILTAGLKARTESDDPAMRQFLFLVRKIGSYTAGHSIFSDPFKYEAFRLAVVKLLELLKPEGEPVSPLKDLDPSVPIDPFAEQMWRSPESRADTVIAAIRLRLGIGVERGDADKPEDSADFAAIAQDMQKRGVPEWNWPQSPDKDETADFAEAARTLNINGK